MDEKKSRDTPKEPVRDTPEPVARGKELPGHGPHPSLDREIVSLAVPALGALVAEPLFVLVDSAIVGHLGTSQLAALGLASTILTTLVGLCIFLAYATTAAVARRIGAGQRAAALQSGIDGQWLALGLGAILAALLAIGAPWSAHLLGATGDVASNATVYLRWSAIGLPGMLLVLASTGVLRGLKDTRTPLWVASGGAVINAALNVALVYGAGLGIAGSGMGTAATQLAMGAVLAIVVVRGARREGAGLYPHAGGIWANARAGAPLFVRTLSLRVAILLTVFVATSLGEIALAGYQVVNSVWGFAAFALDALAIAAQALVGQALGAQDVRSTRHIVRRVTRWGVGAGCVLGVVVAAAGWWFAPLFTSSHDVRVAVAVGMAVTGILMPVAGYVFVLDGILIGAGDGRYLAWAGVATLVAYVPFAFAVRVWAPDGSAGLAWLWLAFAGVFITARGLANGLRVRSGRWVTTGI